MSAAAMTAAVKAGDWQTVMGLCARPGGKRLLDAAVEAAGLSRDAVDAAWRAAMPSGGYVARTGGAR